MIMFAWHQRHLSDSSTQYNCDDIARARHDTPQTLVLHSPILVRLGRHHTTLVWCLAESTTPTMSELISMDSASFSTTESTSRRRVRPCYRRIRPRDNSIGPHRCRIRPPLPTALIATPVRSSRRCAGAWKPMSGMPAWPRTAAGEERTASARVAVGLVSSALDSATLGLDSAATSSNPATPRPDLPLERRGWPPHVPPEKRGWPLRAPPQERRGRQEGPVFAGEARLASARVAA
jgi:hypothetical protein